MGGSYLDEIAFFIFLDVFQKKRSLVEIREKTCSRLHFGRRK